MPATPSLDDIITAVDTWFAGHLRRPPIAHDVSVYNQAYAATEHLKGRLVEMFTGKTPMPAMPADESPEPQPTGGDAPSPAKAKPAE